MFDNSLTFGIGNVYNTKAAKIALAGAAATMIILAAISVIGSAAAKISEADVSCTNGGGQQPGGQQPACTGGGLTQETENQNPSGAAPPGQNK
jgi:hypothetical protein